MPDYLINFNFATWLAKVEADWGKIRINYELSITGHI
jgi:hypothetical protein